MSRSSTTEFLPALRQSLAKLKTIRPVGRLVEMAAQWQRETGYAEQHWIAVLLFLIPALAAAAKAYLYSQAVELYPLLMPAFKAPEMQMPNNSMVNYAAMVLAIFGCVAIRWMARIYDGRLRLPMLHPNILITLNVAGLILTAVFLSNVMMGLSLAIAIGLIRRPPPLRSIIYPHPERTALTMPGEPLGRLHRLLLLVLLAATLGAGVFVAWRTWYPLKLPNDYIELADSIESAKFVGKGITPSVTRLTRPQAEACALREHLARGQTTVGPRFRKEEELRYGNDPTQCPLSEDEKLQKNAASALSHTGVWQAQLGRLLFHHAYLFVPARHLMNYGYTGEVPMLYGLGHTAYYAVLMKQFGDTLRQYFNYYFIGLFIGMAWLATVVGLIARSPLAGFAAFALSLGLYFEIGYTISFLAGGFTPLRFAGVVLQVGSIAYLFHAGPGKGLPFIWGSLVASLLWNTEFAIMGFAGQSLAMIAPALRLGFWKRMLALAVLLATVTAMLYYKQYSEREMMITSDVGLLGIAIPSMNKMNFLYGWLLTALLMLKFAQSSRAFSHAACNARLCILPVLALMVIKCIYFPALVHMYYALCFIFPVALIYFPHWHNGSRVMAFTRRIRLSYAKLMLALCGLFLLSQSANYHTEARQFRERMLEPYRVHTWKGLGDRLRVAAPADAIARRVQTLNEVMKPEDRVLLLSPFDHLLAFYNSPRRVCGHFEPLSNMVSLTIIDRVVDCVRSKPDLLVVFDKSLENICPPKSAFTSVPSCESKRNAKMSLVRIRDRMLRDLVKVKETGDLIIYRQKPVKGAKP